MPYLGNIRGCLEKYGDFAGARHRILKTGAYMPFLREQLNWLRVDHAPSQGLHLNVRRYSVPAHGRKQPRTQVVDPVNELSCNQLGERVTNEFVT